MLETFINNFTSGLASANGLGLQNCSLYNMSSPGRQKQIGQICWLNESCGVMGSQLSEGTYRFTP